MLRFSMALMFAALVGCGGQSAKQSAYAQLSNGQHQNGHQHMVSFFARHNDKALKVGGFTKAHNAKYKVNAGTANIYAYVTLSGPLIAGVKAADFLIDLDVKGGEEYSIAPVVDGPCMTIYVLDKAGARVAGPLSQPMTSEKSPQRVYSVTNKEIYEQDSRRCVK